METTVLLCDFAEAVNGKLYVMGGGWNLLFSPGSPASMSVAVVVAVPWDQTNRRHRMSVELLDVDGQPIVLGDQPVAVEGGFEIGRPPGVKPGSSLNAPFTWRFDGVPLEIGSYEFKVSINGDPVASRPFTVAHPPGMPS